MIKEIKLSNLKVSFGNFQRLWRFENFLCLKLGRTFCNNPSANKWWEKELISKSFFFNNNPGRAIAQPAKGLT